MSSSSVPSLSSQLTPLPSSATSTTMNMNSSNFVNTANNTNTKISAATAGLLESGTMGMANNSGDEEKLNLIRGLEYQNELDKQRFKRRENELLDAIKEKDIEIDRLKRDKIKLIKTHDELSYNTMELDRELDSLKVNMARIKDELKIANQLNAKLKNQLYQIYKNYDNKDMMITITSRLSSMFHDNNHHNNHDESNGNTSIDSTTESDIKNHNHHTKDHNNRYLRDDGGDHHSNDENNSHSNSSNPSQQNNFDEQINLIENKLRDIVIKQVESPINNVVEKIQKSLIEKDDKHKNLIEKLYKNNQLYQNDIKKELKYICEQNKIIYEQLQYLQHKQQQEQELLKKKTTDYQTANKMIIANLGLENDLNLMKKTDKNNRDIGSEKNYNNNKENEKIVAQNIENELNQVATNVRKTKNNLENEKNKNELEELEAALNNVKKRRGGATATATATATGGGGGGTRTKRTEKKVLVEQQAIGGYNDDDNLPPVPPPKRQGRKKAADKNVKKILNIETYTDDADGNLKVNNEQRNSPVSTPYPSSKTKTTNGGRKVKEAATKKIIQTDDDMMINENNNKKAATVTVTRNLRKKMNDVIIEL